MSTQPPEPTRHFVPQVVRAVLDVLGTGTVSPEESDARYSDGWHAARRASTEPEAAGEGFRDHVYQAARSAIAEGAEARQRYAAQPLMPVPAPVRAVTRRPTSARAR